MEIMHPVGTLSLLMLPEHGKNHFRTDKTPLIARVKRKNTSWMVESAIWYNEVTRVLHYKCEIRL